MAILATAKRLPGQPTLAAGMEQPGEFGGGGPLYPPQGQPGAQTNLAGPAPTPLQATPYTPFSGPQAPNFSPTNPGRFTGTAPTPVGYGDFVAPAPGLSAYGQYRIDQGQKAIQRSAAARGNLLTGALQNRLQENAQGIASEEAQKDYERAIRGYESNRATNAQNFGQRMDEFGGNLSAFGANTNATLGFNAQGQSAAFGNYDRGYGATRDAYGDARDAAREHTQVANLNAQSADDYARSVAAQRATMPAVAGRSGPLSTLNSVPASLFTSANALTTGGQPSRFPGAARLFGARR